MVRTRLIYEGSHELILVYYVCVLTEWQLKVLILEINHLPDFTSRKCGHKRSCFFLMNNNGVTLMLLTLRLIAEEFKLVIN